MRVANSGRHEPSTRQYRLGRARPATRTTLLRAACSEFDTATVITRGRTGELHGRPMAVADVDAEGTLWFITNIDSTKVLEIRGDSRAMISLQNSRQFVTMNGHFELVSDRAKVDQLWKEPYRVWFDGQNDPELVLLRFTPFDAEYWDNAGRAWHQARVRSRQGLSEGAKNRSRRVRPRSARQATAVGVCSSGLGHSHASRAADSGLFWLREVR